MTNTLLSSAKQVQIVGVIRFGMPTQDQLAHRMAVLLHDIDNLKWANTRMESPYGTIRSDWRSSADRFEWTVEVPPNSKATLYFPYKDGEQLREGSLPINTETRIIGEGRRRWLEMKAGSGSYKLTLSARSN